MLSNIMLYFYLSLINMISNFVDNRKIYNRGIFIFSTILVILTSFENIYSIYNINFIAMLIFLGIDKLYSNSKNADLSEFIINIILMTLLFQINSFLLFLPILFFVLNHIRPPSGKKINIFAINSIWLIWLISFFVISNIRNLSHSTEINTFMITFLISIFIYELFWGSYINLKLKSSNKLYSIVMYLILPIKIHGFINPNNFDFDLNYRIIENFLLLILGIITIYTLIKYMYEFNDNKKIHMNLILRILPMLLIFLPIGERAIKFYTCYISQIILSQYCLRFSIENRLNRSDLFWKFSACNFSLLPLSFSGYFLLKYLKTEASLINVYLIVILAFLIFFSALNEFKSYKINNHRFDRNILLESKRALFVLLQISIFLVSILVI